MTTPTSFRRFWIQLTADRKRFGMLVGAVCIGLLLWGRLIVVRQPPRMALASEAEQKPKAAGAPSKRAAGADNPMSFAASKSVEARSKRTPIAVELWSTRTLIRLLSARTTFPNLPRLWR